MKLRVRAVTANWLPGESSRKKAYCKVEFDIDTDKSPASVETKKKISDFEQDLSFMVLKRTIASGSEETVFITSFGWLVNELLIQNWGAPKLNDLYYNNMNVVYIEFDWNNYTLIGHGYSAYALQFGIKPWSGLHSSSKRKVERDMAIYEIGKTAVEGCFGQTFAYGSVFSSYESADL